MTLKFDYPMRTADKGDWLWQDPVDDLFDSLINPDSFHRLTDHEAQRRSSDDLTYFFDQHNSSTSGSDTIDTSPMLDISAAAENPWQRPCGSVEQNAASSSPPLLRGYQLPSHSAVFPASQGRVVSSDSDLLSLELALTSHLDSLSRSTHPSHPVTTLSPPLSVQAKRVVTPLLMEKQIDAPYRIGTQQRFKQSSSLSPKMTASKALGARRIGAAAAENGALNLKMSFADDSHPLTLFASLTNNRFKTESLTDYPFTDGGSAKIGVGSNASSSAFQPHPYADEIEPLSPFSSSYHAFPHPNTPVASPTFNDSLDKAYYTPPSKFSKFSVSPRENFNALLTPPSTGQMPAASWGGADCGDRLIASTSASPGFGAGVGDSSLGKAETLWWSARPADQSTAGATPTPNHLAGLGISATGNNMSTSAAAGLTLPMNQQYDRRRQLHHADFASFAAPMMSSVTSSTPISIAPSLILNRPLHSPMELSPGTGMFSSPPSPASLGLPMQYLHQTHQQTQPQQQQRQSSLYRPSHHQRHHTIGSSPASVRSATMPHLHQHRSARTPSSSPPPSSAPRSHKRSKSSHHSHSRRKSSGNNNNTSRDAPRPASVGFVNFTPDDSKRILTGVAPSGSSKTKARREKEAADRRRKLSEAAKKAVLEAGGDLEALEREGVLVLGDGV